MSVPDNEAAARCRADVLKLLDTCRAQPGTVSHVTLADLMARLEEHHPEIGKKTMRMIVSELCHWGWVYVNNPHLPGHPDALEETFHLTAMGRTLMHLLVR